MTVKEERTRELSVTLKVSTYGTRDQARATAERIERMLNVELHQDVRLVRVEYK